MSFYNSFHDNRTPRNPHASDRYTGGSSSGPAAIVASGLCSAALGTDGGGWTNLTCCKWLSLLAEIMLQYTNVVLH